MCSRSRQFTVKDLLRLCCSRLILAQKLSVLKVLTSGEKLRTFAHYGTYRSGLLFNIHAEAASTKH